LPALEEMEKSAAVFGQKGTGAASREVRPKSLSGEIRGSLVRFE
jgi:hypothetical protein